MRQLEPHKAFSEAIAAGLLSADEDDDNYAGEWMYMGTDQHRGHAFKNIHTREYIYMEGAAPTLPSR